MDERTRNESETDAKDASANACCDGAEGCSCERPAASGLPSWLKLLVAGGILLAAIWVGLRSLAAKPAASAEPATAVASASATQPSSPPVQAPQVNQPSCCGGGNAPQGAQPPKCGSPSPGCCGH
ncbi:MAG: hypothetical protein HY898_27540 [Deltaproteobacteria bacterium]|nr:hypothetical protein [Deltaproteobacteria bacterium]